MKIWTKILIGLIGAMCILTIKLTVFCLFSPTDALDFFALQSFTAEVQKLLILLGSFVLAFVALQILAMYWLIRGRRAGYSVAFLLGLINITRGVLMFLLLGTRSNNDIRISIMPIIIGTIMLILTALARNKDAIEL